MAEYTQTYWNNLIEKYRNGTITKTERFELEKKALDDPFLFDALEGFALYENVVEKKKRGILTLPNIAAAASLIILIAVMFNLRTNNGNAVDSDDKIAMVLEDEKAEPKSDAVDENRDLMKPEPSATDKENGSAAKSKSDIESDVKELPKKEKETPAKTTEDKLKDEGEVTNTVSGAIDLQDKEESVPVEVELVEESATTAVEEERITADISQKTTERLENVDKKETPTIPQAQRKAVVENLKEEAESDDAFSLAKKKRKALSYYQAEPVIGKKIFDDYARERIDKRGLRQEKPQEVTIEFSIDKDGNLSNFHHIFTGCSECGPFAISLLQNSGVWKTIPPGFSGRARYTFTF